MSTKGKYKVRLESPESKWKTFLIQVGYPKREFHFTNPDNRPVESRLQDVGNRFSINQTGSGAFLKSAAMLSGSNAGEGFLGGGDAASGWNIERGRSIGHQAGQFLRKSVMQPIVVPAMRRFDSYLKSEKGMLPSVLSAAAVTSIPAFLASLGVRTIRGEHKPVSTAVRDSLLAGAVGGLAGAGLRISEQGYMNKSASFGDSLRVTEIIDRSATLSPAQKEQLKAWVHGLAPELLQNILRHIGPSLGAGAGLLLWSMFAKQKTLAGGLLSAAVGGLAGQFASVPRVPRDAFGNQILTTRGLYGRPRIL